MVDVSSRKTKRAKARKGQTANPRAKRDESPALPSCVGAQSVVDILDRVRYHITDIRSVRLNRGDLTPSELEDLDNVIAAARLTSKLASTAGLSTISSSEDDITGSGMLFPTGLPRYTVLTSALA